MAQSELLEVYLREERSSIQQEKRLFACTLCPYRTDRRNNLKRHTATMHEQSTAVLECCGSRFANKAALRHHTAAYHRHGYICTICSRVFCRRALLRRHHAVHSGFKEFTCSLCDYATSHKSNLERHMKIHESGDKYSTCSPSSSGQQHDRSSPEDFYQADDDSSKSFCVPPPSRDHNPILASLLSQPANDGEVMQWIYHSPYDTVYPSQMFNPPVNNNNTVGDPPAQQSAARRWSYDCQETRFESSTVAREAPLRHAIDVILGIKEELPKTRPGFLYCASGQDVNLQVPTSSCVVTTSSNHWSIGHLSALRQSNESPTFANDASQSSHELNSDMDSSVSDHTCAAAGHKRPWQMVDVYRSSFNQESLEGDFTYVPKKLRMSKRYQTGA
ncbi:hypothetical protein DAPPUDRAFT_311205 [Daphnia pulex]|uniref:C2H2-type domain-containing protein n=1 Tax=Daphnia pulex TaxID=6669 RepID=E9FUZ7_DAPPU|nr:hypothetical protein DAPPUDRAFT_311205 [Daphnia pulex]|eukprot:EFX88808.1 hypothetical protein DAPPUDRAFT_311205 [Daphnia pulex]